MTDVRLIPISIDQYHAFMERAHAHEGEACRLADEGFTGLVDSSANEAKPFREAVEAWNEASTRAAAIDKAMMAVIDLRYRRDEARRAQSLEVFGHTGAHIPGCPPPSLYEEVCAVMRAIGVL